ncbi:hypothetical protein J4205_03430 [Candidatus Pacearchaeota archaeon]|nr:hypothetical protein [Candidatus Pacearchaeota archaeon]
MENIYHCPICARELNEEYYPKVMIIFNLMDERLEYLQLKYLFDGICPVCHIN